MSERNNIQAEIGCTPSKSIRRVLIVLQVVTPLSYPADVFEDRHERIPRDLLAEIIARAQKKLDESLGAELKGLATKRMLRKGDPAREIARAAHDEKARLVIIPTHGRGASRGADVWDQEEAISTPNGRMR